MRKLWLGAPLNTYTSPGAVTDGASTIAEYTRLVSTGPWDACRLGAHAVIYSSNVTPHGSGIAGWTPESIQTAIVAGVDDTKSPLCRPMPSGPLGAFGGMTADDALDIGYYLTTLPPIDSGAIPSCE